MAISSQQYEDFHQAFPNAVHMSGYGNSLFGMFPETNTTSEGIEYRTHSERLDVRVVEELADGGFRVCDPGEQGRILVSRYDETLLILNMLLEDIAIRTEEGICNPHRPQHQFEGKLLY